jgi:hypothetical protein
MNLYYFLNNQLNFQIIGKTPWVGERLIMEAFTVHLILFG